MKLAHFSRDVTPADCTEQLTAAYSEIIAHLGALGASLIELDEPYLSMDLDANDISLFNALYQPLLENPERPKILLQTYFGDIRDAYRDVIALPFDAIGLDFVEGKHNLKLIKELGFPADKTLIAGVVNGKKRMAKRLSKHT